MKKLRLGTNWRTGGGVIQVMLNTFNLKVKENIANSMIENTVQHHTLEELSPRHWGFSSSSATLGNMVLNWWLFIFMLWFIIGSKLRAKQGLIWAIEDFSKTFYIITLIMPLIPICKSFSCFLCSAVWVCFATIKEQRNEGRGFSPFLHPDNFF